MSDHMNPPSLPPGASGEDILRTMLPLVVESAVKSAEGQVASASAIGGVEGQLAELKAEVRACRDEIKSLRDTKAGEDKVREENGKWLRSLLKPDVLYYTLLLIGAALGIRATIPAPVQIPPPAPHIQSPVPGADGP